MRIKHQASDELHEATIELLEDEDWEVIERSGEFQLNWKEEKSELYRR